MAMTAQAGGAAFSAATVIKTSIGMNNGPQFPPQIADGRQILSAIERRQLRRSLRDRRNALSREEQRIAALRVARHLRLRILRPRRRIAIYSAFDGEIDLTPTINIARRMGCVLYAPCIVDSKQRRMEFVAMTRQTMQRRNPFGMIEPTDTRSQRIAARDLDVVLTSVIAFDENGWRLGFGGGYYDRKMAFKRYRRHGGPLFVGVAHDFQRIAPVQPAVWDVLLDAVVTPERWYRCVPR
jgi:5-formyltetrahydrofolate cyclo-ligase